jgi:hypothetical protein
MTGTAFCKEIISEATIATTTEVVELLLCVIDVINKPAKRPMKGLLEATKKFLTAEPLRVLNEATIISTEIKKQKINKKRKTILRVKLFAITVLYSFAFLKAISVIMIKFSANLGIPRRFF